MVRFAIERVLDPGTPNLHDVAMRLVDRITQQLRKDGQIVSERRVWRVA